MSRSHTCTQGFSFRRRNNLACDSAVGAKNTSSGPGKRDSIDKGCLVDGIRSLKGDRVRSASRYDKRNAERSKTGALRQYQAADLDTVHADLDRLYIGRTAARSL